VTPGLEGPSSKTSKKSPVFTTVESPIGYHTAVIEAQPSLGCARANVGPEFAAISSHEGNVITDRPALIADAVKHTLCVQSFLELVPRMGTFS
jgi:hypothetical protein